MNKKYLITMSKTIQDVINVLKQDGINAKQKAIFLLEQMKRGEAK